MPRSPPPRRRTPSPDTHDYSEAETRDLFIDLLLHEAGWPLDQKRDREYEVTGMPNADGRRASSTTCCGATTACRWPSSRPSAPRKDPQVGQQQAKLYADCLEQQFGQRPVIFYTNGYEHWIWDDAGYPPRQVQGFYTKRRAGAADPAPQRPASRWPARRSTPTIVERHYQTARHPARSAKRSSTTRSARRCS